MRQDEVFGASISIHIRFDGSLRDLADKLATSLNISDFDVERDEYPPHEDIGSAEILGWEMWLKPVRNKEEGLFVLQMETENSVREKIGNRMHDLSPWFARLVSLLCDVEATPTLLS